VAEGLVAADTDLVIDFLRGSARGAEIVRELLRERRLLLTSITAFELRVGTDFLDRAEQISPLLDSRTLPLDTLGALRAGETYVRLRERGEDIGIKDALQAGICLRFDIQLATGNVRHFRRVPGLRLREVGSESAGPTAT